MLCSSCRRTVRQPHSHTVDTVTAYKWPMHHNNQRVSGLAACCHDNKQEDAAGSSKCSIFATDKTMLFFFPAVVYFNTTFFRPFNCNQFLKRFCDLYSCVRKYRLRLPACLLLSSCRFGSHRHLIPSLLQKPTDVTFFVLPFLIKVQGGKSSHNKEEQTHPPSVVG